MKLYWKVVIAVLCIALACGLAVAWHFYSPKARRQRIVDAVRLCRAKAERGDAAAQANLGSMYYYGEGEPQDYTKALYWWSKAADQENAKAQSGLGYLYYYGHGVGQDPAVAASWWRKAADQGLAQGQYALGFAYYYGKGVPEDHVKADRWYRKAADQGNADAQRVLGLRGRGLSTWEVIRLSVIFLGSL